MPSAFPATGYTRTSTGRETSRRIPILRLCKFFGLSEGYFLRLQNAYDTLEAKRRLSKEIARIKPYKGLRAA